LTIHTIGMLGRAIVVANVQQIVARTATDAKLVADVEIMTNNRADWQPIDTAPKDGTSFLVAGNCGQVDRAFFIPPDASIGNELVLVIVGGKYEPTHWMSLPPPRHTSTAITACAK
jgi:hypothetical protein